MDKSKRKAASSPWPNKSVLRDTLISETRFALTQSWFCRARWEHKLHFVLALIKLQKGLHFVRFFSEVFPSMSKDAIYAKDSKTNTFDYCTECDDRGLDHATLQYVMRQDLARFAGMDPEDQIEFLTGIVRIGGIAIARRALKELETKLSTSKPASELLEQVLTSLPRATLAGSHGEKKSKIKHKKSKDEAGIENNKKEEITDTENKDQIESTKEVVHEIADDGEETTSIKILHSPQVQDAKKAWSDEMNPVQKEIDAWKPYAKYKDNGKSVNIEVDCLQNLPFWTTRCFARLLPVDTQREIKKLNTFWSATVDAMQKEQNTQNQLEKQVLKTEALIQNRFYRFSQGKSTLKSASKHSQLMKSVKTAKSALKLRQQSQGEKIKIKPRTQTIIKLLDTEQGQHSHTYNDQFCMVDVCHDYLSSRAVACCLKTNLLAITTSKLAISFYSLLTGAQLSPYLLGHSGTITCLCFHPYGDQIFSGSSDSTVRCWNIWSGITAKIYTGHKQPVTCLSSNQKYIVSASTDGVTKVFNILSGQNTATYSEVHAVSCVYMESNLFSMISGNDYGEIKIYSNPEIKLKPVTIQAHNGRILSMYIASNIILTGGNDCYAKVWNKKRLKKCLLSLKHNSPVRSILLSFHQVLCGCESGRLKIWCICRGTLLHIFSVTPELQPIMHILLSDNNNPSNVVIATDGCVKIIEFYKNPDPSYHSHHTICLNDPTRTKSPYIPACQWTTPAATTEILRHSDKISQGGITLQESFYHKRLRNILKTYCTDRQLRNKQPPNTQENIFIDALRSVPQFSQLQFNLTSFPRNTSNVHLKRCTGKNKRNIC